MIDVLVVAFIIAMVVQARAEYVTAPSGLRLRKQPEDGEIIKVIPFGTEVTVLDDPVPGWLLVEYDGDEGVMSAEWLSLDDPADGWTYLGSWHLTGYCWTGYRCADGSWPTAGYSLAHNTLPFGTRLYIQGLGERTVTDRGPGYLGSEWADIFMGSYSECVSWGSQYKDVWLIPEETKTP